VGLKEHEQGYEDKGEIPMAGGKLSKGALNLRTVKRGGKVGNRMKGPNRGWSGLLFGVKRERETGGKHRAWLDKIDL